ncbi:MAG: hypothetical protein HY390_04145 [Deltaproteobacteria bacterium]|nr:hypothetical protein [Deltaproteobacteria bacterium]
MKKRIVVKLSLLFLFLFQSAQATSSSCLFSKEIFKKTPYSNGWKIFQPLMVIPIQEGDDFGIIAPMGVKDVQLALFWFSNFHCHPMFSYADVALESNDPPFEDHIWDRHWNMIHEFENGMEYGFTYSIQDSDFLVRVKMMVAI